VSDPVPGFSSGLRYEKQCVQIVATIFECMNSVASTTSKNQQLTSSQRSVVRTGAPPLSICPRFMRLFDAVWTMKSATAPIFVLKFIRQSPVTALIRHSFHERPNERVVQYHHARSNSVPKNSLQRRAIPQSLDQYSGDIVRFQLPVVLCLRKE
jgi:hypothetical protein